MKSIQALFFVLVVHFSSAYGQASQDLKTFASWLPGSYSSEALSRRDTSFTDVRIHIVPIWTTAGDGYWFYLEQAYAIRPAAPYRQAILHVSLDAEGRIVSANHGLKNRQAFIGAWQDGALRQKLTKDDIDSAPPCPILFRRKDADGFAGGTSEKGCPNAYKNASYFTNESVLTNQFLYTWDRGWSESGQYVWGAKKEGYRFDKVGPH